MTREEALMRQWMKAKAEEWRSKQRRLAVERLVLDRLESGKKVRIPGESRAIPHRKEWKDFDWQRALADGAITEEIVKRYLTRNSELSVKIEREGPGFMDDKQAELTTPANVAIGGTA